MRPTRRLNTALPTDAKHYSHSNYRIEQEIRQFCQQPTKLKIGTPQPQPELGDKSDAKILK